MDTNMSNKYYDFNVQISLGIFSFPDSPEDIVNLIGVKAYSARQKGCKDPVKVIPRQNLVTYRSQASEWASPFEEHWDDFKSKLWEKQDIIAQISKRSFIRLSIIVELTDTFPPLVFSREFSEFIFYIGATFQVSAYDFRTE